MKTLTSADGNYAISYHEDYSGYAQVVTYAGFAPKLETSRSTIPMELLAVLLDKMLFNVTPNETEIAVEPSLVLTEDPTVLITA
jgi:hypothetical protein